MKDTHTPSWFWKKGLHDAKILEINEMVLSKGKKYNCLEINLDSKWAIYDRRVKKDIVLQL